MSTLSHAELLQLKRWNTPTIYNGWEQITSQDIAADAFNLEPTTDFMPQMGPMIGRAVTMVIEPSNPAHKQSYNARAYREYIASIPGPKIVVVQELKLDKKSGEQILNHHKTNNPKLHKKLVKLVNEKMN